RMDAGSFSARSSRRNADTVRRALWNSGHDAPDGSEHGPSTKNDSQHCRSGPAAGHDDHAGRLHRHVRQFPRGTGPLLVVEQRSVDRTAVSVESARQVTIMATTIEAQGHTVDEAIQIALNQ